MKSRVLLFSAVNLLGVFSAKAALTANPTTLYTFDDAPGTADSIGTADFTGAGTLTTGLFGTGASAAPTAGYFVGAASGANFAATQPNAGDFSISFWYKAGASNPSSWNTLLGQGAFWNGGPFETSGYNFELNSAGQVKLNAGTRTSSSNRIINLASASAVNLNAWNHVAATIDSTTGEVTLYLNGVSSTQSITPGSDIGPDGDAWYRELTVARNPIGSASPMDAVIDDVGIWQGSTLTAFDVSTIFNGGSTGTSLEQLLIPEPSSAMLAGFGLAGLLLRRKR